MAAPVEESFVDEPADAAGGEDEATERVGNRTLRLAVLFVSLGIVSAFWFQEIVVRRGHEEASRLASQDAEVVSALCHALLRVAHNQADAKRLDGDRPGVLPADANGYLVAQLVAQGYSSAHEAMLAFAAMDRPLYERQVREAVLLARERLGACEQRGLERSDALARAVAHRARLLAGGHLPHDSEPLDDAIAAVLSSAAEAKGEGVHDR